VSCICPITALISTLTIATVPQVAKPLHFSTAVFMSEDPDDIATNSERGVSIDQDGKSNVWAIEPKVEVEAKSSEEKTTSAFVAVGGIAVFGVLAAGILTHLPDPNQF